MTSFPVIPNPKHPDFANRLDAALVRLQGQDQILWDRWKTGRASWHDIETQQPSWCDPSLWPAIMTQWLRDRSTPPCALQDLAEHTPRPAPEWLGLWTRLAAEHHPDFLETWPRHWPPCRLLNKVTLPWAPHTSQSPLVLLAYHLGYNTTSANVTEKTQVLQKWCRKADGEAKYVPMANVISSWMNGLAQGGGAHLALAASDHAAIKNWAMLAEEICHRHHARVWCPATPSCPATPMEMWCSINATSSPKSLINTWWAFFQESKMVAHLPSLKKETAIDNQVSANIIHQRLLHALQQHPQAHVEPSLQPIINVLMGKMGMSFYQALAKPSSWLMVRSPANPKRTGSVHHHLSDIVNATSAWMQAASHPSSLIVLDEEEARKMNQACQWDVALLADPNLWEPHDSVSGLSSVLPHHTNLPSFADKNKRQYYADLNKLIVTSWWEACHHSNPKVWERWVTMARAAQILPWVMLHAMVRLQKERSGANVTMATQHWGRDPETACWSHLVHAPLGRLPNIPQLGTNISPAAMLLVMAHLLKNASWSSVSPNLEQMMCQLGPSLPPPCMRLVQHQLFIATHLNTDMSPFQALALWKPWLEKLDLTQAEHRKQLQAWVTSWGDVPNISQPAGPVDLQNIRASEDAMALAAMDLVLDTCLIDPDQCQLNWKRGFRGQDKSWDILWERRWLAHQMPQKANAAPSRRM